MIPKAQEYGRYLATIGIDHLRSLAMDHLFARDRLIEALTDEMGQPDHEDTNLLILVDNIIEWYKASQSEPLPPSETLDELRRKASLYDGWVSMMTSQPPKAVMAHVETELRDAAIETLEKRNAKNTERIQALQADMKGTPVSKLP